MPMPQNLLTPDEVVDLLRLDADGCDRETALQRLRNRCRAGQIPFVKIGRLIRFRPEQIDAVVTKNTRSGPNAAKKT